MPAISAANVTRPMTLAAHAGSTSPERRTGTTSVAKPSPRRLRTSQKIVIPTSVRSRSIAPPVPGATLLRRGLDRGWIARASAGDERSAADLPAALHFEREARVTTHRAVSIPTALGPGRRWSLTHKEAPHGRSIRSHQPRRRRQSRLDPVELQPGPARPGVRSTGPRVVWPGRGRAAPGPVRPGGARRVREADAAAARGARPRAPDEGTAAGRDDAGDAERLARSGFARERGRRRPRPAAEPAPADVRPGRDV